MKALHRLKCGLVAGRHIPVIARRVPQLRPRNEVDARIVRVAAGSYPHPCRVVVDFPGHCQSHEGENDPRKAANLLRRLKGARLTRWLLGDPSYDHESPIMSPRHEKNTCAQIVPTRGVSG